MSITLHERPGVYVEYDTTTRAAPAQARTVGIAARGTGDLQRFDAMPSMGGTAGQMIALALEAGASEVVFYPVAADSAAAYGEAVAALLADGRVGLLAVETQNAEALTAIAALLCAPDARACIAFAGMAEPTTTQLVTLARALNCERLVLLGADVCAVGADAFGGGCLAAAAMAGLVSAQDDPAIPLHGAQLPGLAAVSLSLSETQLDTLVRAGVSPLEAVGSQVRLIRAVTTRTTTDSAPDATWRELTTVCILDDLLPAMRSALAAKFLRRKNTAVTRNAIRSQAALVLDDRVRREIIEAYNGLSVEAVADDPTTCRVSFTFRVVQGLSRIHLSVHMIV